MSSPNPCPASPPPPSSIWEVLFFYDKAVKAEPDSCWRSYLNSDCQQRASTEDVQADPAVAQGRTTARLYGRRGGRGQAPSREDGLNCSLNWIWQNRLIPSALRHKGYPVATETAFPRKPTSGVRSTPLGTWYSWLGKGKIGARYVQICSSAAVIMC